MTLIRINSLYFLPAFATQAGVPDIAKTDVRVGAPAGLSGLSGTLGPIMIELLGCLGGMRPLRRGRDTAAQRQKYSQSPHNALPKSCLRFGQCVASLEVTNGHS